MKLPIEKGDAVQWRFVGSTQLNGARIIGILGRRIIVQINPFDVISFSKDTLRGIDAHGSQIELVPME